MYVRLFFVNLLTFLIFNQCKSANILGVVPFPSYSHQVVFRPLWRELSLRGHNVTVLTTDPVNDLTLTNLTEIDLRSSYDIWRSSGMVALASENQMNMFKYMDKFTAAINAIAVYQLEHPRVQKLIQDTNVHFDLVVVEPLISYGIAFSERFKCPYISMLSLDAPNYFHSVMGNPAHPILYPDVMLPFAAPLTFPKRIVAVMFLILNKFMVEGFLAGQTNLIRKYIGENIISADEILKKASMMFVNANPAFSSMRPLTPTTIIISGGTHLEQPKPLPQDIQEYLDNSTNGVIYFSLGSNVKSTDLPVGMRNIILEALAELPYNVLWKFEEDNLPRKPNNVLIAKWFPQPDILRHPNIKVFITQGGLQSIDEAIFANVPFVGMPFFADQMGNVDKIVNNGLGLAIDRHNFDKDTFKRTIVEVVDNPTYRHRVKEVRQLSTDRPMSGIEAAVWWTEYMLRHNDTNDLKSPYVNIPLYQYLLLDVISFILFITLTLTYIVFKLTRYVFKVLCRSVRGKQKTS